MTASQVFTQAHHSDVGMPATPSGMGAIIFAIGFILAFMAIKNIAGGRKK